MSANLSLVALSYTGKKLKHCTEKVLLLITRSSEQRGGFHTTYEYLDFDEYTCSNVFLWWYVRFQPQTIWSMIHRRTAWKVKCLFFASLLFWYTKRKIKNSSNRKIPINKLKKTWEKLSEVLLCLKMDRVNSRTFVKQSGKMKKLIICTLTDLNTEVKVAYLQRKQRNFCCVCDRYKSF